jgi:hypothetical protein
MKFAICAHFFYYGWKYSKVLCAYVLYLIFRKGIGSVEKTGVN